MAEFADIRTSNVVQDVVFQPASDRLVLDTLGKSTMVSSIPTISIMNSSELARNLILTKWTLIQLQESQNTSSSHPIMDMPVIDHLEDALEVDALPVATIVQGHDQDPIDNGAQKVLIQEVGTAELEKKASDDMSAKLKPDVPRAPMVLNAKITKVEDTGKGATAAWHAISKGAAGNDAAADVKKEDDVNDRVTSDGSSLPLNAEGRLPFFLIDAHEEPYGANPGTIYMFGKVCIHTHLHPHSEEMQRVHVRTLR